MEDSSAEASEMLTSLLAPRSSKDRESKIEDNALDADHERSSILDPRSSAVIVSLCQEQRSKKMCLAIPGKLLSITGNDSLSRMGRVEFGGIVKQVSLAYV